MAYAILRTAKLKEVGHIAGSLSHTFRSRETPNADPARLHQNEHHGPQTPEAVLDAIKDRLPEKVRSNGVRCIEYFIGGSPEHFRGDDGSKYFEDARAWLIDRHGAENVISTHVHRDETTPHMVAYVVPMHDGRLNARHYLGGPEAMRELQTDFAQKVGRQHGLERGVEGSKAKHQTIRDFYARTNEAEVHMNRVTHPTERLVDRRIFTRTEESDQAFADRVAGEVKAQLQPAVAVAARADEAERRVTALQRHNAQLQAETKAAKASVAAEIAAVKAAARATILADRRAAEPWHRAVDGLPPALVAQLGQHIADTAQRMKLASEKFIGWLGSLRTDPQTGREVYDLERQDNGRRVQLTLKATEDLNAVGAKYRDLVEVNAFGGKIVERRHEQAQSRGMER